MSAFGRPREQGLGCGFLSQLEVDALVEGRLSDERMAQFWEHLLGCRECYDLAASVTIFHEILDRGAPEAEQKEFARTAQRLKARLRQEIERNASGGDPVGRCRAGGLSASELEGIAAAGPAAEAGSATPDATGLGPARAGAPEDDDADPQTDC